MLKWGWTKDLWRGSASNTSDLSKPNASFSLLYSMEAYTDAYILLNVIGHQWYWSYEYSDYVTTAGKISFDSYMVPDDELELGQLRLLEVDNSVVLPVGVYIRLNVSAADVLHSWAVPSLGIKIDGKVPREFIADVKAGKYDSQLNEEI